MTRSDSSCSDLGRARRVVRATALVLAAFGLTWALWLSVVGGIDTEIFGRPFTTNEPMRPLLVAVVALMVLVWAHGVERTNALWLGVTSRFRDRPAAVALSVGAALIGYAYCTTAAVGPDQYGYVSQADLWLQGDLKLEQPWVSDAPWPSKRWSFSPLGYRPIEGDPQWTIVPTYSSGLPLLMAGAKFIGGQPALFLIVPILGGLMVLATYGIGCRLGSSRAGLIAAWLVSTSTVFLSMLPSPMSDAAVGGVWALVWYFLLGRTLGSAAAAGLLSGLAIMIRPNLFFVTGAMGLWLLARRTGPEEGGSKRRVAHALVYGLAVVPGVVAIAIIYTHLYGSPTTSGYGRLEDQFAWAHIWPNVTRYFSWYVDTQTPIALVGLAALFVPLRWIWPWVLDRGVFVVAGAFVGGIWAHYCGYLVFDDWRFIRFLLPCWPFIMLGLAASAIAVARRGRPAVALATTGLVIWLGVFGVRTAARESAFDLWRIDRRYVSVARFIRESTEPGSVVLSMIHSGSLRYYGSRMTLRYDILDPDWLDRAVEWMTAHGVHVYAVVDEWELADFKKRFADQHLIRVLDTPIVEHHAGSTAFIYDLSQPPAPLTPPRVVTETFVDRLRAVPPAPPPSLIFRK